MSQKRVKFLTGPPDRDDVEWHEGALSVIGLLPAFLPNGEHHEDTSRLIDVSFASTAPAKWRHIPLDGATFYATPLEARPPVFHPISTLASSSDDFIDHSIALLDDLQSSQLAAHEETVLSTATDDSTSFYTTQALSSISATARPRLTPLGPITPLCALPSAAHIARIRPQTVTVNLIAAIVSVAEERTVSLRRQPGRTVGIVEAVLADDTRAGVSLTVWLGAAGDGMREAVRDLRRGDVLCVERVALAVYAGVVFGQTLNRRVAGVVTRITRVEAGAEGGSEAVDAKLARVREWVRDYVGPVRGMAHESQVVAGARRDSWLPEDSQ